MPSDRPTLADRLAALEDLAREATPGRVGDRERKASKLQPVCSPRIAIAAGRDAPVTDPQWRADAAYLAALPPAAVLALVAAARALEAHETHLAGRDHECTGGFCRWCKTTAALAALEKAL